MSRGARWQKVAVAITIFMTFTFCSAVCLPPGGAVQASVGVEVPYRTRAKGGAICDRVNDLDMRAVNCYTINDLHRYAAGHCPSFTNNAVLWGGIMQFVHFTPS